MRFARAARREGFTLVELAIVLVVIGLLIGGILVAQSRIETARTEKVISEISQIEIQFRLFHERYNELPGDGVKVSDLGGNQNGFIDYGSEGFNVWTQTNLCWNQFILYAAPRF